MDIDFAKIKQLRENINELIKEKPELEAYQKIIDQELEKAGDNPWNRCVMLHNLILEKRMELIEALKELKTQATRLQKAAEFIKECKNDKKSDS